MSSHAMQATAMVRPGLFISFSTRVMPSPLAICVITQRVAGVKRLWLLQMMLEMSGQRVMLWQTTKISMGQSQQLFNVWEKEKLLTAIISIPRRNPGMSDVFPVPFRVS